MGNLTAIEFAAKAGLLGDPEARVRQTGRTTAMLCEVATLEARGPIRILAPNFRVVSWIKRELSRLCEAAAHELPKVSVLTHHEFTHGGKCRGQSGGVLFCDHTWRELTPFHERLKAMQLAVTAFMDLREW